RTIDYALECRARWPRDVPLRVSVRTPLWFSHEAMDEVVFSRNGIEIREHAREGLLWYRRVMHEGRDRTEAAGVIGEPDEPLTFDVRLERPPHRGSGPGKVVTPPPAVLWTGQTTLLTQIVETIEEAISP